MIKYFFFYFIYFLSNNLNAKENILILKLKDENVEIELFDKIAPKHVDRIKKLAEEGKYDNVVFHRVIDGFRQPAMFSLVIHQIQTLI